MVMHMRSYIASGMKACFELSIRYRGRNMMAAVYAAGERAWQISESPIQDFTYLCWAA